ncbi:uncharacterized protein [Lolium perenne]|uniref:uncharacterized protein isoform X2 n=1 Tax=Lolium perenne TaxID=4522 RepID=UPI0021F62703|nr:uncharacterized protein LOC127313867 isoform X2 [Lolium perenne]
MEDLVHEKEQERPPESKKNPRIQENLTKIKGPEVDLVANQRQIGLPVREMLDTYHDVMNKYSEYLMSTTTNSAEVLVGVESLLNSGTMPVEEALETQFELKTK